MSYEENVRKRRLENRQLLNSLGVLNLVKKIIFEFLFYFYSFALINLISLHSGTGTKF